MPIINGIYTPLTFDESLAAILDSAPSSIVFSPGNPPELVLANMFAQSNVLIDQYNGQILASLMSPVGSTIDLLNPNNPRRAASAASGYVYVTNSDSEPKSIAPNTIIKTLNSIEYTVGISSFVIPGNGSAYIFVSSVETGVGGNIPSGQTFTITGYPTLSGVNTLPFLNGAPEESDALYLNRLTLEQTEYGSQNGSVAVETEIKKYYADARMYVNNTPTALSTPIPVPAAGYNLVVLTPNGVLSEAADINQIFTILSERLEFVNAQSVGSSRHEVFAGTIYTSEIPQVYYFTMAQPVETTLDATIYIKASEIADRSELIEQANSFALAFVNRLVSLFSGVDGDMTVTYIDGEYSNEVSTISVSGSPSFANSIAPAFGIATLSSLVYDIDTAPNTPQIIFDSINALSITLDPQVAYESALTMSLVSATKFVNFKKDALFSDNTSWYDRYMYINPANINITVQVSSWI